MKYCFYFIYCTLSHWLLRSLRSAIIRPPNYTRLCAVKRKRKYYGNSLPWLAPASVRACVYTSYSIFPVLQQDVPPKLGKNVLLFPASFYLHLAWKALFLPFFTLGNVSVPSRSGISRSERHFHFNISGADPCHRDPTCSLTSSQWLIVGI